jgi:arylesterase/paraoxonase
MKILKRILAVLGILVLLIGAATAWLLARGGAFRAISPHFAGTCTELPLEGSGEDIVIDRERGFAYLSHMDRLGGIAGKPVQGMVMRVDLNSRPFAAVPALASKPGHFRPHGMSLWIGADGERRLFVINHGAKRGVDPEAVELFRESAPGEFVHEETFRDPLLLSPNDLAAVGPRQFYVANDKPLGGGMAAALQQAGIGASPITYFDGTAARYVVSDIASGGGINTSLDHRTVYVAETAGQRVRVLDRDQAGNLAERARVPIATSPDNIDVAADGSLWVTGHANTLALIRHFINGHPAPTQVWRVTLGAGGADGVEEIYLDDGQQMSAGSVGATWNDLLLIGSITAPKIQVCERSGN